MKRTTRNAHDRAEERRDQALRDIVAVDEQLRLGEIPPIAVQLLRADYERRAAEALAIETRISPGPMPRARRTGHAHKLPYLVTALTALLITMLVLPRYVGLRPTNGFVTGNEPLRSNLPSPTLSSAPPPTAVALSPSLLALEAAVSAQPTDMAARLGLANGYTDQGHYNQARRQYQYLLSHDPANVEGRAHYAWLLLQTGHPKQALTAVQRALTEDPSSQDAAWFLANIDLYGRGDAEAALPVLRGLQQRPNLDSALRDRVNALAIIAAGQTGHP